MNYRLFFLIFILSYAIPTIAQETTGSIQGYIVDQDGNPVEFANIKMIDQATNATSGSISQIKGFYSIPNLNPSIYLSLIHI